MEHAQALEQVTELTERLNSLEHTFLNDPDGTADAFGFGDARARMRCTRRSGFPGGARRSGASIWEQTHQIRTGRGRGRGRGRKPVPIDKRAPWQK